MKIIMLIGRPNSGKTTTFNLLYDEFMNRHASIKIAKSKLGSNSKDFECVIEYMSKEVALFSMGDYLNQCIEAIIKYSDKAVLVVAYSDKFAANLGIMVGKYMHHDIIRKTNNNDEDVSAILAKI